MAKTRIELTDQSVQEQIFKDKPEAKKKVPVRANVATDQSAAKPLVSEKESEPEIILSGIKAKENTGSAERLKINKHIEQPEVKAPIAQPTPAPKPALANIEFSGVAPLPTAPDIAIVTAEIDNEQNTMHSPTDKTKSDEPTVEFFVPSLGLELATDEDEETSSEILGEARDKLNGIKSLDVFDKEPINTEYIQDSPTKHLKLEDWLEIEDSTTLFAERTELALETAETKTIERAEMLIDRIESFILEFDPNRLALVEAPIAEVNEFEESGKKKLTALVADLAETLELDYSEPEIAKIVGGLLELSRQPKIRTQLPASIPIEKGTKEFKLTKISNLLHKVKKPAELIHSFLGFIVLAKRFDLNLNPDKLTEITI